MSYSIEDFQRDYLLDNLDKLSSEDILTRLTTEDILTRLTPEDRLKGLNRKDLLKSLKSWKREEIELLFKELLENKKTS